MAFWHRLFGGEGTDDSIELIRQNLSEGTAVLLDVRSHDERAAIYLKDSIFISISAIKSLDPVTPELDALPKDKIVYCH